MGSSILPPTNDPPEPPAPRANSKVVCEFCRCTLTPAGDVLRMSDEARTFNKQAETIRDLKDALGQAEGAGEAEKRRADKAETELAQLRPDAEKSRARSSFGWE